MPSTGIGPAVGWTSLHDAAKIDDLESLICSVEAKKGMPIRDVDMPSATGLTPLHVAGMHGSTLCIPYLVSMNSDLTIQDSRGRLAVHYAAESGHVTACMQLIASGQDLNHQDHEGNAPLHLAARGSTVACEYLIEIGASLSIRNNRGWTPLQSASVPMYSNTQEILEESMKVIQKIRRDADPEEARWLLQDCGMDRFEPLFLKAGYGTQHLLVSCKPVSLTVLNESAEHKVDMMSLREYLFFLENLARYHGVPKTNPFSENAQKQRYWDDHPEEFEAFCAENPDYDVAKIDDSEWRRPVYEKEKEYMEFLEQVVEELKAADKFGAFSDMLTRQGLPITGDDGRVYVDSELMYKDMEQYVDNGWRGVPVMDFNQISANIRDGMYGTWDQLALDFVVMICNVFIYCRAAKSDQEPSFKQGIGVLARGLRVLRKHRTALLKKQSAMQQERAEVKAKNALFWNRWSIDKRLRGLLPDLWRDAVDQAAEDEDDSLTLRYLERFETVEESDAFWKTGPSKNMFESARKGWEDDSRVERAYKWIKWALDVAISRDRGMHLQHNQADPRSDMHMPLADFSLAKTRAGEEGTDEQNLRAAFIRETVWSEDFDGLRARLSHAPEPDFYSKYPDDIRMVDQIMLGFLVILSNVICFHDKHHLHMKKVMDKKQLPLFIVPKSPIKLRIEEGSLQAFQAKILWDQLAPKPGENVIGYEIELITAPKQDIDPSRTLSLPGKIEYVTIWIGEEESFSRPPSSRMKSAGGSAGGAAALIQDGELEVPSEKLEQAVDDVMQHPSFGTGSGGWCEVHGLTPATDYLVYMRAIAQDNVFGPVSGPVLRFQTAPHWPEMVPNLVPRHVTSDAVVLVWDAPRDNGSGIIDYEVEYMDLSFRATRKNRVGYDARNFSTAMVQMPPGSDDPLKPGYALPPRESILLPATRVTFKVRGRNRAGWGPWVNPLMRVSTLPDKASEPQAPAITGRGPYHVELSWMPPVRSNSLVGITGYRVYVKVVDGEKAGYTREVDISTEGLQEEAQANGWGSRPSTSTSRSGQMSKRLRRRRPQSGSSKGSRRTANGGGGGLLGLEEGGESVTGEKEGGEKPKTAGGEEDRMLVLDEEGGGNDEERPITGDQSPGEEDDEEGFKPRADGDREVELDEVDLQSDRASTTAGSWWAQGEFAGNTWFAYQVPDKVITKALFDFPTIDADNNLIVLQTRTNLDWDPEKYAVLPTMPYRAEQLANRLQRCLQDAIPPEWGLRFTVVNTADQRLQITLNRQFRLKLAPSLAYALGVACQSNGWVVSPVMKNVGLSDDKSCIDAIYPHKLNPTVCDLLPTRIPHTLVVKDLPPGSLIEFSMCAKNGAGKVFGDIDSLGRTSVCVSDRTEPVAPPPPFMVEAEGVLSTAILVKWKPPLTSNGSTITRFIVEYNIDGVGPAWRSLDPLSEGFQINNLSPGQKVFNIRLKSESDIGLIGPDSQEEARRIFEEKQASRRPTALPTTAGSAATPGGAAAEDAASRPQTKVSSRQQTAASRSAQGTDVTGATPQADDGRSSPKGRGKSRGTQGTAGVDELRDDGVWARTLCQVPSPPLLLRPSDATSTSITFTWEIPRFDGGTSIIEWELRGHRQSGEVFEEYFPHPCTSHTVTGLPEKPSVGEMLLAVTVRARNSVGWSPPSDTADGKCSDGPPPHPDRMNKYMRDRGHRQSQAVLGLVAAIEAGLEAQRAAEGAALQPMRVKKARMEEAENMVLAAERALVAAIEESDAAGIGDIGLTKPKEDVEARMLLERLRQKRVSRWGASKKGIRV